MKAWRRVSVLVAGSVLIVSGTSLRPDEEPKPTAPARRPAEKTEKRARPGRPAIELVNRASEELLDLQRKTRALLAQAIERRKVAQERLQDLTLEKRSVERAVAALKQEVEGREKNLLQKKETLSGREKEADKLKHELSSAAEPLKQFIDRVEKLVEGGIAWKIETRKKAVQVAREQISSAPLAAGLSIAGRLSEEEEGLARLAETGTVEVEVRGEPLALPAFHLGLLAVVFASEDGSILGYAQRGQKLEEGILARPKSGIALGYRKALDVLRRRRMPELVNLYLPSLPRESEETK